MKIPSLLLILLVLPSVLRAQTMPGSADTGAAPTSSMSAVPAAVAPPATAAPVMSDAFGHKPNPTPPPAEVAVPLQKFFNTLRSNNYVGAYETFLAGTPLGEQKEKMSAIIGRTQEAFGIYGPLNDYELYDTYPIGSNVLIMTYLTRHQRQPLRWRFIFYRPAKTWTVVNMGFDDVLLDLLQQ